MSVTARAATATRIRQGLKTGALFLSLVISAGLMAVALASPKYPWVAWVTLVPLLLVIRVLTARSALACGALWGSALFLISTTMVGTGVPATIRSFVLLTAVPAIYTYLGALLTRRVGFNVLILAFGWCGVELALLPLGLRGGLLGGIAGGSGSFLSFLQGLLGYVCMAALVVAVNAIVLSMLSKAYVKACALHRIFRRSAKPQPRFIPREIPIGWRFYGHAAQPRAPPVSA